MLNGQVDEVISRQLDAVLPVFAEHAEADVMVAYEPVWAIGTGRTADADTAAESIGALRASVATSHGDGAAEAVRILYGGSVNPGNIAAFMAKRRRAADSSGDAPSSDSDIDAGPPEGVGGLPARRGRPKRHRFQTFDMRVAAMDDDAHAGAMAAADDAPGDGHETFTAEALAYWRELNTAAAFNELYAALVPLTQTLPELVLHADAVFARIDERVKAESADALPAILALAGGPLARDLAADYAPLYAKLGAACARHTFLDGARLPHRWLHHPGAFTVAAASACRSRAPPPPARTAASTCATTTSRPTRA